MNTNRAYGVFLRFSNQEIEWAVYIICLSLIKIVMKDTYMYTHYLYDASPT